MAAKKLPSPSPGKLPIGAGLSLADAKPRKDRAQQIVRAEFSGDFAQRVLGQAQFFGDQVEPERGCLQVRGRSSV